MKEDRVRPIGPSAALPGARRRALLVGALLAAGCAGTGEPAAGGVAPPGCGGVAAPGAEWHVPAEPPDSIPDRLYNPESYVTAGGVTYLRDVVVVRFVPAATAGERECAVAIVRGRVVGGARAGNGDGVYYVRIAHDGSDRPLLRAIEVLRRLPQVADAGPEYVDAYGPS